MRRMMVLSGLLVVALAGCQSSLPAAAGPGSTPGAAPTAATITPTAPPGSAPAQHQAASSNSPGAAELDFADSTGDSLTMSYSFSPPEPGSHLRRIAQAGLGCAAGRPALAAELVIPFTVSVTLNSGVSMNIGLSTAAAALGYAQYQVVYDTGGGYSCQGPVNDTGAEVPFSLGRRGDTARATAWLVLDNAVSGAQPEGSQDRIGRMGLVPVVYEGNGLRLSSASGLAVCTAANMQNTPVWLHVGGTVFSSQHCGQAYQAPGTKARTPGTTSQ